MKSSEYWAERFSALEERGFRQTESLAAIVDKIYRGAQKGIEDDLRAWYTRLAENNALSLQDAKRFLNTSELEEFRWTVEEYIQQAEQLGLSDEIKKKLENASARYHIRRLEAIQLQVEQRLAAATAKAEDTMLQELTSTVEEISSRTMYEVQKGLNVGFNVSQIDGKTVQQLLNTGWSTDGKTFSARLWENQQKLVSTLEQQLTQAIIQGKSLSQVVQQLTKTMESSRFNIARVVYTESAHAIETGKLTAYEELGVDELEIIATLDARTCATCGDLDGKTVRRTDAVSGVSIPPWHPRCRCTTAPAVDEKYGERIARDENGETYTVPADTTYEQWKEQQSVAAEGTKQTGGAFKSFPDFGRRDEEAESYYENRRSDDSDIEQIAKNTGLPLEMVSAVKDHMIKNTHILDEGIARFDASYDQAVAWQRLINGEYEERDLMLLNHEYLESQVEKKYNLTYREAHAIAEAEYAWDVEIAKLPGGYEDASLSDLTKKNR